MACIGAVLFFAHIFGLIYFEGTKAVSMTKIFTVHKAVYGKTLANNP
jgi:hypothetical protein